MAVAAFATLLGTMTAHVLAETARDALFLASIPASRLPWVYLGVALAALVLVRVQRAVFQDGTGRTGLVAALAVSALVTGGFWLGLAGGGTAGLYALYVWSGVQSTMLVVQFYTLLSSRFTVRQAKRLYPAIGVGAVLGALAGAGLASVVARVTADRHLLAVSAAALALTIIPALAIPAPTHTPERPADPIDEPRLFRIFAERQYARHLGALVVVAAMAGTAADFAFKWTVADHVPAADLGRFFATAYLAFNAIALVIQLGVAGPAVRRLGVTSSLMVMPVLLGVADVALLAGGGLAGAVVLKAADGTLRHTLQRNAVELLYVPMPDAVRSRIKDLIDIVGHRGGQAAASLAILGLVAWRPGVMPALVLLAVLLAAWAAVAFTIRRPYIDVYRRNLERLASMARSGFPELDLASLETLMARLDSANDREVLAALDILAREDRAHLVPTLILYHPSPEVVVRALELFEHSGRTHFVPVADRVLGSASPEVHAAIVRARMAVAPDPDLFRRLLDSSCPASRTTAVVALHLDGALDADEARRRLDAVAEIDSVVSGMALARALRGRSTPLLDQRVSGLADHADVGVRREAVRAMAALDAPHHLPTLVRLLSDPRLREEVREALFARGEPALEILAEWMADRSLTSDLRWELPATVARFPAGRAATVLVRHLVGEPDGMMEYRVLRALEAVQLADPDVPMDRPRILAAAESTMHEAARLLDWRLSLEGGAAADPARATDPHDLLVRLLRDKEHHAMERAVRLAGLLHATEDFGTIQRGLDSGSARARSSGTELLELLVEPRLRGPLLALVDDGTDAQRLAGLVAFHPSEGLSYDATLERMLDTRSSSLRTLTVAQVGELRKTGWSDRLRALESRDDAPLFDDVLAKALSQLQAVAS